MHALRNVSCLKFLHGKGIGEGYKIPLVDPYHQFHLWRNVQPLLHVLHKCTRRLIAISTIIGSYFYLLFVVVVLFLFLFFFFSFSSFLFFVCVCVCGGGGGVRVGERIHIRISFQTKVLSILNLVTYFLTHIQSSPPPNPTPKKRYTSLLVY